MHLVGASYMSGSLGRCRRSCVTVSRLQPASPIRPFSGPFECFSHLS
uniref:Uncharacterized protein n=1 Tax=Anguilla anguilla TaxID=7936 RepID=A0A0E9PEW6_ANGAN